MSDRPLNNLNNQDISNQSSNHRNTQPEGTTAGDPAMGEAGLDKTMSRVEGENEPKKASSKQAEVDIAKAAD